MFIESMAVVSFRTYNVRMLYLFNDCGVISYI